MNKALRILASFIAAASCAFTWVNISPAHATATLTYTFDPAHMTSYARGSSTSFLDTTGSITGTMSGITFSTNNCGTFDYNSGMVSFGTTNFGNQFSLSAWVKVASSNGAIQTIFANAGPNVDTLGFKAFVNGWTINSVADNKVYMEAGAGGGVGTSTATTGTMTKDSWQHLLFTFDNTAHSWKIYLNGSLQARDANVPPANVGTNQTWWLGSIGGSFKFVGSMGVVRIFSTILNDSEASVEYNTYSARYAATPTCPAVPANSIAPVASGTSQFNQSLTTTQGTWSGSPSSYSYQWSSASTSGGTYTNISGATSASYTLTSAEIGKYLKVTVTAVGTYGTASWTSTAFGPVTAISPTVTLTTATPQFRTKTPLTFTANTAGKVKYLANGKNIPGCQNLQANAGNSYTVVCNWKPSTRTPVVITTQFTPSSGGYTTTTTVKSLPASPPRSGNR